AFFSDKPAAVLDAFGSVGTKRLQDNLSFEELPRRRHRQSSTVFALESHLRRRPDLLECFRSGAKAGAFLSRIPRLASEAWRIRQVLTFSLEVATIHA